MVLAEEGTPNSNNKMEHFSYIGEWANALRRISQKANLQLPSSNFSLKQLCTIVKKFHY